ncbi:MAG: polysaccharide deacetylase family protein [Actinomycetota bacterium]|nr:polysaccharide deacetylase family protein [Actinomycetota bacterium]
MDECSGSVDDSETTVGESGSGSGVSTMVTLDVHPRDNLVGELENLGSALEDMGLSITLFVPAALLAVPGVTRALVDLRAANHEIGCHGLTHDAEDSYAHLPEDEQRRRLTEATRIIEDGINAKVDLFRAPVFRLSAATLRVLDELGYRADTSVPSTRLSILSSDMWNLGYLRAPRRPYHPAADNAFRTGTLSIWEVPVSCYAIPFTVSFLQVFGARAMQRYLSALVAEGRRTGKPVVYMAHPEDFFPSDVLHPRMKLRPRHFLPSKTHGFAVRYAFGERDERKIYDLNTGFVAGLTADPRLAPTTLGDYVDSMNV